MLFADFCFVRVKCLPLQFNFFKMDFDKNTVIGITLIILIFLGFSIYNANQEAQFKKAHPETAKTTAQYPAGDSSKSTTGTNTPAAPAAATDSAQTAQLGTFAAFANGSEQLITIENENCIYTFSNKGGVLKKVVLKGYETFEGKPLVLFEDKGNNFNLSFVSNDSKKTIETQQLYFATASSSQKISGAEKLDVIFKIDLGNGKTYEHHYVLNGKGYAANFTINAMNFGDIIPRNASYLTLHWGQTMPSQEGGIEDQRANSTVHYMNTDKEEDYLSMGGDDEEKMEKQLKWVAFKQKFFNTSLIADKEAFATNATLKTIVPKENTQVNKEVMATLQIPFNGSNAFSFPMQLYTGPNKFNDLKSFNVGLDKIIPLGGSILGLINKYFIIPIFHVLSKFITNYGIIILLLALSIKLVTFPFTYKSTLSMIKMKVLKPELDELKKKYPNQAEYGQKQMELYSQTGVSPFGGCLPMLLQMPILIAMYRFFPATIELRQQPFLWAKDLSSFDSIFSWSTHIPLVSTYLGNHISLFTILMAVSSVVVTKISSQSQPTSGDNDFMAQQMKIMMYVMPFMLLFIFNKQPAALSYYYFLFNILTIGQNWIIQKFFVDEAQIHLQIQENKKKPVKQSAFQQKMQEMMKQQQELKKGK